MADEPGRDETGADSAGNRARGGISAAADGISTAADADRAGDGSCTAAETYRAGKCLSWMGLADKKVMTPVQNTAIL